MWETAVPVLIGVFALLVVGVVAFVGLRARAARLRMVAAFREVAKKYGGRVVEPTMKQPEDFEALDMQLGDVMVEMVIERPTTETASGHRVIAGPLRLRLLAESAAPNDVAIDLIPGGDARDHRLLVATGHTKFDELFLLKSKDPEFATEWLGSTACEVLVGAPWLGMELKEGRVKATYLPTDLPSTVEELDVLVRAVAALAMGEENAKSFFSDLGHIGGYREATK